MIVFANNACAWVSYGKIGVWIVVILCTASVFSWPILDIFTAMTVEIYSPQPKVKTANALANELVVPQNQLESELASQPASQPKKVFIATQGCQMNEYDSSRMADLLADTHGMVATHDPNEADVLLMNTCSIREKAQEKVFSELGRWKKLKDKNPDLVIGVGGCVASQEGDNIQKRAAYVDMVFGPQTLHRLPELLDQHAKNQDEIAKVDTSQLNRTQKKALRKQAKIGTVDISFPEIEKFDFLPEPEVQGVKAFVSIMEGCSKYCSFCVVPYTRGEEVSRPLDDVLAEVATLAEKGVREITLLGQNVNGYRGEKFDGGICRFAELLYLVSHVEGVQRIRYTTSHPLEFTDDIIQAYADLPKLVNHLHLPVQSGSNKVLAGMKRNHTIDIYIEQIRKLRAVRPDLHLSGDFIIGFPGETEADFEESYQLAKDLDYDHSYSFVYSKRPGTPAADLPDDVSLETKKARLAKFQELINRSTIEKTKAMVGTQQTVLIEKLADRKAGYVLGTAENTRSVQFKGDASMIGKFATVNITDYVSHHLVGGEMLEIEATSWMQKAVAALAAAPA